MTHLDPESLASPRSPRWMIVGTTIGAALIVLLFLHADGSALLRVLREAEPGRLVWPVLCTIGSYAAMARSYQKIAAAAGLYLRFGEMARVTLVSTAANYVLSTGGLSGLAVRSYYFLQRHDLGWGAAVSISLAQTFVTNLVLFAFVCWGVLSLSLTDELTAPPVTVVAFLFLVALGLSTLVVAAIASRSARERIFAALIGLANGLSRRFVRRPDALRARLAVFEEELHEGIDFLIARRRQLLAPIVYIFFDWLLMLATLHAAFYALDEHVPLHVVVIGFSVGVFLSVVNLVPGGLGLMEGSMAAVFSSLGTPLETAVVATLIFRLSYYVLPLAVTLLLFPDMLNAMRSVPYTGHVPRGPDLGHPRSGP